MRTAAHILDWRRINVLELNSQGLNQTEISRQLKVNQSIISRDFKFLREYARKKVESHLQEKLPEEYQLCMTGLNQVLKKSWEITNSKSSTVDDKTKLQLSLVNECYKYKMDLVTNGVIITDAIKFVEQKKEYFSEVK